MTGAEEDAHGRFVEDALRGGGETALREDCGQWKKQGEDGCMMAMPKNALGWV